MRVLTWNLWWRLGCWRERRYGIARTLADARPDICGLQEVWGDGEHNFAMELAEELGFHCVFAPAVGPAGAAESGIGSGNAILTRWPVRTSSAIVLDGGEQRSLCYALIEAPGGPVPFFTTHLTYGPDKSALRSTQVRSLLNAVAERSGTGAHPVIVTGDFNSGPESEEIRILRGETLAPGTVQPALADAWQGAGAGPGYTWSRRNPHLSALETYDERIDYIMVGPPRGKAGRVLDVRLAGDGEIAGVWPSDHFAVVADLSDGTYTPAGRAGTMGGWRSSTVTSSRTYSISVRR